MLQWGKIPMTQNNSSYAWYALEFPQAFGSEYYAIAYAYEYEKPDETTIATRKEYNSNRGCNIRINKACNHHWLAIGRA